MVESSPKRRIFTALIGGKLDRVPVTSLTGAGGTVNVEMQKATGIYWPDAHKDPEKMANLTITSYELSGLECVRVPFDIGVEAEAFGCKSDFGRMDLQPSVIQCNYNSPNDLKMPRDPLRLGRIPVVLQAIGILREKSYFWVEEAVVTEDGANFLFASA